MITAHYANFGFKYIPTDEERKQLEYWISNGIDSISGMPFEEEQNFLDRINDNTVNNDPLLQYIEELREKLLTYFKIPKELQSEFSIMFPVLEAGDEDNYASEWNACEANTEAYCIIFGFHVSYILDYLKEPKWQLFLQNAPNLQYHSWSVYYD